MMTSPRSTARTMHLALFAVFVALGTVGRAQAAPEASPEAIADMPTEDHSSVAAVPASPIVSAARTWLTDPANTANWHKDDAAAALEFLNKRSEALWVDSNGPTVQARALLAEMSKADHWGLEPAHFHLPDLSPDSASSTPEALASLEARITVAALTYARHARGGRTTPSAISRMIDMQPQLREPATVLSELADDNDPAAYLVGLHPKHEQFQKLAAELQRRLGPVEPEEAVTSGADTTVKLPDGATLKPRAYHDDIALLRQRLGVPAAFAGRRAYFDEDVTEAVRTFQAENNIKVTGQLDKRTRNALNGRQRASGSSNPGSDTQRLIVNMERWRWMPDDMGELHVLNNVPEFVTRTYKNGAVIFKEKIIVGQPSWPTPTFSAQMRTIEFNPSWGVPPGIKAKELEPRIRKAGSGGGFFDQLFGGGNTGGAAVIRAQGLTPYINGRPVNPDSVDWSKANLNNYSFIQPPGPKNPLGFVKFMFPNSHNVYMHDTIQRDLFNQSHRPYSHGCIRVQNPGRFAEVLLNEDKGWSPDRVKSARNSSAVVVLDRTIAVHTAYLTTWIGDDGKAATFGDVYGLDSRVSKALGGKPIQSRETPHADIETASTGGSDQANPADRKKRKKTESASTQPSSNYRVPGSFSEAMSGLTSN